MEFPNARVNPGDHVSIIRGPFKGATGKVLHVAGKVAVFLDGAKEQVYFSRSDLTPISVNPRPSVTKKMSNLFKRWHQRDYERVEGGLYPWPTKKSEIKVLGKIVQIDYISDKWHKGEPVYYYHNIDHNEPLLGRYRAGGKEYYAILGIQPAKPEGLVEVYSKERAMIGYLPPPPQSCVKLGDFSQVIYENHEGEFINIKQKADLAADENGQWIYIIRRD